MDQDGILHSMHVAIIIKAILLSKNIMLPVKPMQEFAGLLACRSCTESCSGVPITYLRPFPFAGSVSSQFCFFRVSHFRWVSPCGQ